MPACEQVVYRREQLDCTIWAIEGPTEAPEDSETVEEAPEEAHSPRSATEGPQTAAQGAQAPRSLWSRIFGGR
jgi:hypothetical protein